jgi:hypothetical protein
MSYSEKNLRDYLEYRQQCVRQLQSKISDPRFTTARVEVFRATLKQVESDIAYIKKTGTIPPSRRREGTPLYPGERPQGPDRNVWRSE